ncbi:restriction endonuclease subunit S [Proteiniborus sp.]|uniref:restriction endonuclease subunit S n=1 Tax=Proteiniborus sp. TaxID=2079015 RepID=UPI003325FBDB
MQVNNVAWVECKFIDDRMDSSSYITQINMGLFDLYKKESTDFQIKTLDDICNKIIDGPFGSDILEEDYVEQGVPFIRVQNITEYGFEDSNLVFISEKANKRIIRSECRPGDLVFTKTGRLGTVCVLNNEYSNYNIRGDLAKLQLKSHIDPYYVMSYLNSNFGTKITNSYSSGSTRGRILISNIKKIFTPIPSPEIQKCIGDKVRKAEELREEAKRLKKEAEEIIYKKLNNIELEDEKNYTVNFIKEKDVFERIDSEYYKEKYFILQKQLESKGFVLKTLDKLCDSNIYNGKTYKTTNEKRKYMNIGVGELGDWFIVGNEDKYIDENINTRHLIDKYSIVWGNSAHLAKYIGEKVNINLERNLYVSTTEITCIKPNLDKINPYYLFLYMKSNWGYYQIQRTVKGMTAHSYPGDISRIIVPILDFSLEELDIMKNAVELGYKYINKSKQLIQEAKQDVEDLIEGNFDMSKIKVNN